MILPVTFKFCPTNTLPPIPTPPVPGTIKAPVVMLVLGIRLLATMAPPAQILPPIPIPPGVGTTNAPVVSLVLGVLFVILTWPPNVPRLVRIFPPTKILPLIPTPPTTCSAPVVALTVSLPPLTTSVPMFSPVIGLMLAIVAPLMSIQYAVAPSCNHSYTISVPT